jgi:hypothetical protein
MSEEQLLKIQIIIESVGFALIIIPLIVFVVVVAIFLGKLNPESGDWYQLGLGFSSGLLGKKK